MQNLKHFARKNKFALLVAAGWLVAVWLLISFAQLYSHQPLSLAAWAGSWDGAWYRSIVEGGYANTPPVAQTNLTFFPLLPVLTWVVKTITQLPTVWAGMAVSSLAFTAALVVLYRFVVKHFTVKIAKWTLILLAFNPFSFYFGMMYTEALFALMAVCTLWFVFEKKWWYATTFAGLATATRSVGVGLSAMVMVAWLYEMGRATHWHFGLCRFPTLSAVLSCAKRRPKGQWADVPKAVFTVMGLSLLSVAGLLVFLTYLYFHAGDFFAPQHAQQFWPGRGGLSNVVRELSYLFEHKVVNLEYALTAMWYVSAVVAFIGLYLVIRLKQYVMAIFAAIALSLPILFGTASSMNRYSQVVIPIFIAYTSVLQKQPRWLKAVVLSAFAIGMAVVALLMVDPRNIFVG